MLGGSLPYIRMAHTAVFTERLEVRPRIDQKNQLDELSSVLTCDIAALVRLAIDRMFEELETNRKREAKWQEQIAEFSSRIPASSGG